MFLFSTVTTSVTFITRKQKYKYYFQCKNLINFNRQNNRNKVTLSSDILFFFSTMSSDTGSSKVHLFQPIVICVRPSEEVPRIYPKIFRFPPFHNNAYTSFDAAYYQNMVQHCLLHSLRTYMISTPVADCSQRPCSSLVCTGENAMNDSFKSIDHVRSRRRTMQKY